MYSSSERTFIRVNFITIITLFVLILAGGVVRSTGSGMGCPDWPKCFDQYIPPTSFKELPDNYQQKYVAKRLQKNERFAKMLDKMGKSDLAYKIRNDHSIALPEEFNPAKTWTEYINRLIGAFCGLLLLLTFYWSLKYYKISKRVTILSFINLILVLIQAWLGSIVVSTNLVAWIITVHMLLALAIVGVSIYTYYYAKALNFKQSSVKENINYLSVFVLFTLILSVIQIAFGTELRETIDFVASQQTDRQTWISRAGEIFNYHRDISILVIVTNIALYVLIKRKVSLAHIQKKFAFLNLALVLLQMLTGLTLSYLSLPPVSQALHILFASLLFGNQLYLFLLLNPGKQTQNKIAIN